MPSPIPPSNHKFALSLWICFCSVSSSVSFLFRFHIWGMSYDISHSLSDLLDSVWQSLGPHMLLQMALFHSFYYWVISHCVYESHLIYPFLCWWTFRLLPCLDHCKQCFCLVSQSCPTLCDPMDCSQAPLSMEILQARILEWVVIPSPEDLSDPGIKPRSPTLQTDSLLYELQGSSYEQHVLRQMLMIGWWGTRTHHTKKTVRNWGAQLAK